MLISLREDPLTEKNVATPYPFLPTPLKKHHERIEHNLPPPQRNSETALMLYTQLFSYNIIALRSDTYSVIKNYLLLT